MLQTSSGLKRRDEKQQTQFHCCSTSRGPRTSRQWLLPPSASASISSVLLRHSSRGSKCRFCLEARTQGVGAGAVEQQQQQQRTPPVPPTPPSLTFAVWPEVELADAAAQWSWSPRRKTLRSDGGKRERDPAACAHIHPTSSRKPAITAAKLLVGGAGTGFARGEQSMGSHHHRFLVILLFITLFIIIIISSLQPRVHQQQNLLQSFSFGLPPPPPQLLIYILSLRVFMGQNLGKQIEMNADFDELTPPCVSASQSGVCVCVDTPVTLRTSGIKLL